MRPSLGCAPPFMKIWSHFSCGSCVGSALGSICRECSRRCTCTAISFILTVIGLETDRCRDPPPTPPPSLHHPNLNSINVELRICQYTGAPFQIIIYMDIFGACVNLHLAVLLQIGGMRGRVEATCSSANWSPPSENRWRAMMVLLSRIWHSSSSVRLICTQRHTQWPLACLLRKISSLRHMH
jgi:hypothetical protein